MWIRKLISDSKQFNKLPPPFVVPHFVGGNGEELDSNCLSLIGLKECNHITTRQISDDGPLLGEASTSAEAVTKAAYI